jgi:uncharacterized cupredoxin-like copper-binding protein
MSRNSVLVATAFVAGFGLLASGLPTLVFAHDKPVAFSAGEPGNPRKPSRVIEITMREGDGKMMFRPAKLVISRGEQIRFKLKNVGLLPHEFLLATTKENVKHAEEMKKFPEMEHDEPNGIRLEPNKSGEVVWRFTKKGEFEYGCLIPGHREAGMIGIIVVK